MNENQPPSLAPRLSDAQPKRIVSPALPPAHEAKGDGRQRIIVRITGRRVRLLDPDNFAGGCKYLVDQMRKLQLIPEDDPETISLVTTQIKVATFAEEGTEVEVIWP